MLCVVFGPFEPNQTSGYQLPKPMMRGLWAMLSLRVGFRHHDAVHAGPGLPSHAAALEILQQGRPMPGASRFCPVSKVVPMVPWYGPLILNLYELILISS